MGQHRSIDSPINRYKNSKTSLDKGLNAEDFAVKYLKKNGYKILARNYSKRICEVDIIGLKGNVVNIIEVKVQASKNSYSFDQYFKHDKLTKIRICAELWLLEKGYGVDTSVSIMGLFLKLKDDSYDVVSFSTIGV